MGYFFVREMSKINQIFKKDDVREALDSILMVLRGNSFIPFPLEMVNQAFYHSSRYSEAIAQDYKKNYTLTIKKAIEKAIPEIETPEQQQAFDDALTLLQNTYIDKIKILANSRSGVYSSFMAGRSNFNSKQANRRGNAYDQVAGKIENWISHVAPNLIYNEVIAARSLDQINARANEKAEIEKRKLEKRAADLWEILQPKEFPFQFGKASISKINFSRDKKPKSFLINDSAVYDNKIEFSELFGKSDYPKLLEILVNQGKKIPESWAETNLKQKKASSISSFDSIELDSHDPLGTIDKMIEAFENNRLEIYKFLTNQPVSSIQSGQIKPDINGKLINGAVNWFRTWLSNNGHNGVFHNEQLGDIVLSPRGIKNAMNHKPHPIDIQAIPALPEIMEKVKVLDVSRDDEGKPIKNIVAAAPILIDGEKYYLVLRLRQDLTIRNEPPRFYTVAVEVIESANKKATTLMTSPIFEKSKGRIETGGRDRLLNILYEALTVNHVFRGRSNNVKTAKGTKVSTVFAVLEADQVIASHTATGAENPNYPQELQPRDRSRESSQAWVQKTSNTLDPESLGRSGRADTGAPIIGEDLVVESGNGRTMAIQLAYERGNADEYKEWLIDEAEYFGFSADQINQFKQPILVRIRTSEIDRIQFTVEANQDDKLSFSATERAKTDARRLDENLLSLFTPGEDGDLITASNQKFIQGFLKSLGETEAAQYIGTDGKPTQALVTRMKAAIFSKAYNDDRLLEMMADQTKPDLQNMLNALGAAAPKFIEAQAVSRGDVQDVSSSIVDGIEQALDKRVTNAIIDAANTILAAKQNDQDIVEFVKQQGLFGDLSEGVPELAVFLSKNSRSAKKMSLLFKAMAEFAEKEALDSQNMGLFGEPEPVSIKDAINYAVKVIEDNYGDNANLSMFDSIDSLTAIDEKAHDAATSPHNDLDFPTAEQKQTGEYQKGHLSIGDLKIAIENPAGSIRSGSDPNGNEWQITMKHHYGFIENTTGADGDEIDVFVKNNLADEPKYAYIIKQLDINGQFDEQKVIIGAESEEEAKEIYLSNYEKGWKGLGGIKKISMADLLKKIQHTWSEFDSWARDGSYDHIPVDQVIIENAPKIIESKIDKEDPIVVLETHGKYHIVIGLDRIKLANQRHERFIPAIIFDGKDISKSIIQNAIKKAGSKVDPVALAALILDELEKSLVNSFDDISNPVLEVLYQNF